MARMSIDDKFPRDPRVIKLGRRVGWSRRETMGALIDVFQIVYDRERDVLPAEDIDIAAELDGFAAAMIECDLAESVRAGVRIKGAAERIDYLRTRAEAGRAGGLKSGESRRNRSEANDRSKRSTASPRAEASRNPPDPSPSPDLPSAPDPDPAPDLFPDACSPPAPRGRRPPSGDHQRVIAAFETRYTERNGRGASWGATQGNMVKQLLAKHPADEIIRRIGILFDSPPLFLANSSPDLGTLVQHFDKLVAPTLATGMQRAGPHPNRNPVLANLLDDIARREAAGET